MAGNLIFVHAADIHLDSPLHGLSRSDEAFLIFPRFGGHAGLAGHALFGLLGREIPEG